MSSAYIVELSAGPGGARWAETHTWTEPFLVQRVLERFARNEKNLAAYHAIISGALLGIWVVEDARLTRFLDVRPFLRADLGHGAMTLSELWNDEAQLREWAAEMEEVDPWLERVHLELFWDPIAEQLPALTTPLLAGQDCFVHVDAALRPPAGSVALRLNPIRLGSWNHATNAAMEAPR